MSADATDVGHVVRIRNLEKLRCSALQNRDSKRLDELLHPDFVYVHASGRIEYRADYLDSLTDQHTTYGHFTHRDVDITLLGDCALMGGVLSHSKTARGNSRNLLFRFTAAWAAHGPGEWRLLRWHNTKIVPFPAHRETPGAEPVSLHRRDELR
jgi:ketosteroid isomerase-like protein